MNSSVAPARPLSFNVRSFRLRLKWLNTLDALSSPSRAGLALDSGKRADLVARVLVDKVGDGALPGGRALRLKQAPGAIGRAAAVAAHPARANGAHIAERLVGGAAIRIAMRIWAEHDPYGDRFGSIIPLWGYLAFIAVAGASAYAVVG